MKSAKFVLLAFILTITSSKSFADGETVYVPGYIDCSSQWSNYCGWPMDSFYDPSGGGGGTTTVSAGSAQTPDSWNHNRTPACLAEQRWVDTNIAMIVENDTPIGTKLPITIVDPNFQPSSQWAKYEMDGIGQYVDSATGTTIYYSFRMHYMWRIGGGLIPYQVKLKNSYENGCVGAGTPAPHP